MWRAVNGSLVNFHEQVDRPPHGRIGYQALSTDQEHKAITPDGGCIKTLAFSSTLLASGQMAIRAGFTAL